jgi:DNA-binding MarR family transcriptional regulator
VSRLTIDQAVERVQFSYPQIYFACHTRHDRRRSNAHRLSARDAEVLVHLNRREPVRLTSLARHLGLAASTLSTAIAHLERMGYVEKAVAPDDRRAVALRLTSQGVSAVRSASVLEPARLGAVLRRMTPVDRRCAIEGLSRLASACRRR